MSDRHIRILRAVAHRRQQQLHDLDAPDGRPEVIGSTVRRHDLERTAARTRARLAAAQARRRHTDQD
jgi:hypothetical protein